MSCTRRESQMEPIPPGTAASTAICRRSRLLPGLIPSVSFFWSVSVSYSLKRHSDPEPL